ncbi:hypothetical protein JZ751_001161 [Albula glossodonta]|uniref:PH and SEC7 domain-containing protein 4-like n=1 Tax=Albula glossodonta TaxID=121402 RepID=A0A8T2PT25_9TELE|nr:hypothetical protein JZ751_001161 [Albula glossodonta]
MEEDLGCITEPNQQDTDAQNLQDLQTPLEPSVLESKPEEGEEEDAVVVHKEAGEMTWNSSSDNSEEGDLRPLPQQNIPGKVAAPASSTSCMEPSTDPKQECEEEKPVTNSQEVETSASGQPEDVEEVVSAVPPTEILADELHEEEVNKQEVSTPIGGANNTVVFTESPTLNASMEDSSASTDGQSSLERKPLDCHAEWTVPAEVTGLSEGDTVALMNAASAVVTDSEAVGTHGQLNSMAINEDSSLPIRSALIQDTVSSETEETEGREAEDSLSDRNEAVKKEAEEEVKQEEEKGEWEGVVHKNEHSWSIREQVGLSSEGEDTEETELLESPKENDCTVLCEQVDQILQTEESEQNKESGQKELLEQVEPSEPWEQPEHIAHLEQSDPDEEMKQLELAEKEQSNQPEQVEQAEQTEQPKEPEQPKEIGQSVQTRQVEAAAKSSSEHKECPDNAELTTQTSETMSPQQTGEQTEQKEETPVSHTNGGCVDREGARRLAERLYNLQDMQRSDVVKHLDKDNDFSHVVGEEYLKFFDFTGQSLDQGLRSFLRVVVLIGETQERERVLGHFAQRFHQCNPESFSSTSSVLTLTCAVMLLNTDLHGQNVGKAMSLSSFVSNLNGMNDGENFNKDLLKSLYNTIKNEQLEWAVDEEELKSSMVLPGDEKDDTLLRSKSNPFQDVPHDKKAMVYKQGFLTRKAHADIDGKRTPWGKRSWKTFYAVLKGMVLYLQKDEYRIEWQSTAEVISVHHALAERADDYTKRLHVFRLQTADWRVFLFQASTAEQMSSWIHRINLVSALYSSPPFPAAVGSQKRFSRPILPAMQSALTLEKQLQSHSRMLDSFLDDLSVLQQPPAEGRKPKAREVEERRQKEEYLMHEKSRYEAYKQMLEVWKGIGGQVGGAVGTAELDRFDGELCVDFGEEEEATGLKKSHSSPSINLEPAPAPIVKVKRNISERRTYRKIIVPRRNREL